MQETLCSSILVDNKEMKPFTHLSFTYNCNHLKNVKIISTVDQPLGKSLWETFKDGVKHFLVNHSKLFFFLNLNKFVKSLHSITWLCIRRTPLPLQTAPSMKVMTKKSTYVCHFCMDFHQKRLLGGD